MKVSDVLLTAKALVKARLFKIRTPLVVSWTLTTRCNYKCVYCESKLGHNTPGDTEHKIPSSIKEELHFAWDNLTLACTECNRRKSNYYVEGQEFLDPYNDDVENLVRHLGPLVSWAPGNIRAEITVKKLELHTIARLELFARKAETIDKLNTAVERWVEQEDESMKALIKKEIEHMTDKYSEYSGMVISTLAAKGVTL